MTGARSLFADLRTRVIWGSVVAIVALACIWLGGIWIAILTAVAAGCMMAEWRMITAHGDATAIRRNVFYILAVMLAPLAAYGLVDRYAFYVLWIVLTVGVIFDGLRDETASLRWSMAGCLYIGVAAIAFVELRLVEPFGFLTILWAALVVVATDVGGYFAGRTIGGPKLWPAVSPKKTWAGLAGGVVFAFVSGGLFSWATTGTYFVQVCAVSAIAAVLAQAGDLGESALKRHFGVKDASSLIPGHGGVLDRLDGHMAAILVAAAVTFWRGEAVFVW